MLKLFILYNKAYKNFRGGDYLISWKQQKNQCKYNIRVPWLNLNNTLYIKVNFILSQKMYFCKITKRSKAIHSNLVI